MKIMIYIYQYTDKILLYCSQSYYDILTTYLFIIKSIFSSPKYLYYYFLLKLFSRLLSDLKY